MASKQNGTLYIGVTSDLIKRVWEHKSGIIKGFTASYNVKGLVYFEVTSDVRSALEREKELKRWKRSWKLDLIEKENPAWDDLYEQIVQ